MINKLAFTHLKFKMRGWELDRDDCQGKSLMV